MNNSKFGTTSGKPRILFVAPTGLDQQGQPIKQRRTYLPGLTGASIASVTPEDVEIKVISETSEDIPWDEHWDMVGVSGMGGSGLIRGWQIADAFRAKGVKTVAGGIAATLAEPGWSLEHADHLVMGEAEDTWPQLVNDFIQGNPMKEIYRMEKVPDVNSFPVPAYDGMDWKRYGFWRPVQATRGCPFPCSFCSISAFFERSYRKRPVEQVIRDVRAAKASGSKYITFIDDNIGVDFNYCQELWEALIPENIIWASQCSIQISEREDMLDLAYRSGCRILSFGIESVNNASLEQVEKGWNRPERYKEAFDTIRKHRIAISSEMIVGLDGDGPEVFQRTFDFLMENRIELPRIYIITPVPGTPLYLNWKQEGRIIDDQLVKYNGGAVVFRPKMMKPEQLQKGYWKLYQELYSSKNILKRIGSNPARQDARMNLFTWATNIHYRGHIKRGITPGIV